MRDPEAELIAAGEPRTRVEVRRTDLFLGFLKIGLLGFGGVAPWAYHVIVDERRWLTDPEYSALLGIGQILPGPNTVNAAVMIGDRFRGVSGAVVAVLGLMAMPLAILIGLAQVYARFADVPLVRAAIAGSAAAAAGLVIGTALKMAVRLKPSGAAIVFGVLAFAGVVLGQQSLILVLAVLGPLSIAAASFERRA